MKNASSLEIISTLTMGISLLCTLISLAWVWWKYHIYRKPDAAGRRANGASQWLFARDALLYAMLAILTGLLCTLSIMAMFVPPPIRSDTQEQMNAVAIVYIVLAVLVSAFAVANLWIGIVAFRGDRRYTTERKSLVKARAANKQAAAMNASNAAANAADSAANSEDALANASDAAANASRSAMLAREEGKE